MDCVKDKCLGVYHVGVLLFELLEEMTGYEIYVLFENVDNYLNFLLKTYSCTPPAYEYI
jgi:hypothetical protein